MRRIYEYILLAVLLITIIILLLNYYSENNTITNELVENKIAGSKTSDQNDPIINSSEGAVMNYENTNIQVDNGNNLSGKYNDQGSNKTKNNQTINLSANITINAQDINITTESFIDPDCMGSKEVKSNITYGSISPSPPRFISVKILPNTTETSEIYGQLDDRGWHTRFQNRRSNAVVILLRNEHPSIHEKDLIIFPESNISLTIDQRNINFTLPTTSLCWKCNKWFILYDDNSISMWEGTGYIDQWLNNKITSCPHDEFITKTSIIRLSKINHANFDSNNPEHNNYKFNFNDYDGINKIEIIDKYNNKIISNIPNCQKEFNSSSLTILKNQFPLTGFLIDCKSETKNRINMQYPFLPDDECIDQDGENLLVPGIAIKGQESITDQCAKEGSDYNIIEAVCINNELIQSNFYCPAETSCDTDKTTGNALCRSDFMAELIILNFTVDLRPNSNRIYPTVITKNIGNKSAKYFTVSVKSERAEYKKIISEILPGKTFEWGFDITKQDLGEILVANADIYQEIEESNEDNNNYTYILNLPE